MQYILTQQELDALTHAANAKTVKNIEDLQSVCTLAALHVPVPRPWGIDKTPKPWGCILDKDHHPTYCDECPVKKICPYKFKEWSK